MADKVPVTVVTGFLGAGKTTLVNHILTGNHGKKIAVIENEFGEVGIDDALVLDTREEIFEMNNGCVCCTVRGDLIRVLGKLLKRKNKFDAILIETTGLADPAPVAQTFFVDDDLKAALRLDAILTVVDAKHVLQHLDEDRGDGSVNESIQQVAFADKLLLNKVDLVSEEEKAEVLARVRGINAGVDVIECTHAAVPLDRILGQHAFDLDKILGMDPAFLKVEEEEEEEHHHHHHEHGEDGHCVECEGHGHDHDHDHEHHHHEHHEHGEGGDCAECASGEAHDHHHGHGHGHAAPKKHKHNDRVSSVGIELEGSLDMGVFNRWLSGLLQEKGADIYRSKGILSIAGRDDRFVFHGVHMMVQLASSAEGLGKPWQPGEVRTCRAVFIGKDLNRQELNDGFRSCLAVVDGGAAAAGGGPGGN